MAPILMTWGRPKTTDTADQDKTRRNKKGRFILETTTILKFWLQLEAGYARFDFCTLG